MCTPMGHTMLGLAAWVGWAPFRDPGSTAQRRWSDLFFLAGMSMAPDADLIPGVLTGDLNAYHHMFTHTLGWVVLISVAMWFLWKGLFPETPRVLLFWGLCMAGGHLVQDMLTRDAYPPIGVMLFWPISEIRVHAPVDLFPNVQKADFADLFQWRNLRTVAAEFFIMGIVILALSLWRKAQGYRRGY